MNYQKDLPDLPSQDGRTIDAMSWGEICTIAMHYQAGKLTVLVPVEVVHEVSVRPDQTLSALLLDTGVDITDGRFAIVKVGEWDAEIGGSDADPSLTCPKCRTGDWMHGIGGDDART